jgi:hypothetical protein
VRDPRAPGPSGWRVIVLALASTALVACAGEPASPTPAPALCRVDTMFGTDKPPRERVYPPQYWFVLLVSGYRASGEIARPARDCRGLPTTLSHDGCAAEPPPLAAAQPLTAADLHITALGDVRRLIWIETNHLPDGRSEGPVAIVDLDAHGLAVRALGILRGYHDNVALRLAPLSGGTVLAAESERCETLRTHGDDGRTPRACDRAVRLVPLVGDHFLDEPMTDDAGRCESSSLLPVRTSGTAPDGARYQLEAGVTFAADAVTLREQLALTGTADRRDVATPSFVTRVEAERRITLRAGSLVASAPGLLSRWLSRHGAVAAP